MKTEEKTYLEKYMATKDVLEEMVETDPEKAEMCDLIRFRDTSIKYLSDEIVNLKKQLKALAQPTNINCLKDDLNLDITAKTKTFRAAVKQIKMKAEGNDKELNKLQDSAVALYEERSKLRDEIDYLKSGQLSKHEEDELFAEVEKVPEFENLEQYLEKHGVEETEPYLQTYDAIHSYGKGGVTREALIENRLPVDATVGMLLRLNVVEKKLDNYVSIV